MSENKPTLPTTPIPPITPIVTAPKKGFSWGAFLAGCCLGCLLPIIFLGITAAVGSVAIPQLVTKLGPQVLSKITGQVTGVTPTPTPTPPASAENCGTDMTCLGQAVQTCTPAKSEISNEQFGISLNVLGRSLKIPGNCQVSFAVNVVNNPQIQLLGLEGQSMTCDVKPAVFSSPQEILSAPDSDLNCDGPLWGLIKIVRAGQSQQK